MGIVRKYKAKLEKIENPLKEIHTLTFSSDKKFKYKSGQFLHLALDEYNPAEQWPDSRCFSMQSSSDEEMIKITYAVKGKFTRRMAEELVPGKEFWLKLPYGELFQTPHEKEKCVFIAGGTGLTPFLSLFHHASFSEYKNPKLYLGFRSKSFNIFANDIKRAQQLKPDFNVSLFFENTDGILDINKIYEENKRTIYFISGPPAMIKTFKQTLIEKGVPKENILTDDWE